MASFSVSMFLLIAVFLFPVVCKKIFSQIFKSSLLDFAASNSSQAFLVVALPNELTSCLLTVDVGSFLLAFLKYLVPESL